MKIPPTMAAAPQKDGKMQSWDKTLWKLQHQLLFHFLALAPEPAVVSNSPRSQCHPAINEGLFQTSPASHCCYNQLKLSGRHQMLLHFSLYNIRERKTSSTGCVGSLT